MECNRSSRNRILIQRNQFVKLPLRTRSSVRHHATDFVPAEGERKLTELCVVRVEQVVGERDPVVSGVAGGGRAGAEIGGTIGGTAPTAVVFLVEHLESSAEHGTCAGVVVVGGRRNRSRAVGRTRGGTQVRRGDGLGGAHAGGRGRVHVDVRGAPQRETLLHLVVLLLLHLLVVVVCCRVGGFGAHTGVLGVAGAARRRCGWKAMHGDHRGGAEAVAELACGDGDAGGVGAHDHVCGDARVEWRGRLLGLESCWPWVVLGPGGRGRRDGGPHVGGIRRRLLVMVRVMGVGGTVVGGGEDVVTGRGGPGRADGTVDGGVVGVHAL